ncbi:MAG: TerB family tellurite resistance protein [Pseudomonadota bacterium]
MLKAIKTFFDEHIMAAEEEADERRGDDGHALRLATAALLVEMSRQDEAVHKVEQETIERALRERFDLAGAEVDELCRLAQQEVAEATDYYQFTALIKDHLSVEQKERVVELLWQVAIADGHIDSFEEHMVRRIADLLYLPHSAFIRAKHRALGE